MIRVNDVIDKLTQMRTCLANSGCGGCPHHDDNQCICLQGVGYGDRPAILNTLDSAIILLSTPAEPAMVAEETSATAPAADMINHPPHYTYGKRECIEEMELLFGREAVIAYCRLAAYKYKHRAGHKGPAETDYGKADRYLDMLAERLAAPDIVRKGE